MMKVWAAERAKMHFNIIDGNLNSTIQNNIINGHKCKIDSLRCNIKSTKYIHIQIKKKYNQKADAKLHPLIFVRLDFYVNVCFALMPVGFILFFDRFN